MSRRAPTRLRIGIGFGLRPMWKDLETLSDVLAAIDASVIDSLWMSDHLASMTTDPIATLGFAAASTKRVKLGTSILVLPGRPPAVVAKSLATIDLLSGGRLLPVFGLGTAEDIEHAGFGVERRDRGRLLDQGLETVRQLLATGEAHAAGSTLKMGTRPYHPLDLWTGGRDDRELRRAGRIADGWLGHFMTVEEARRGRALVEETAADHEREIDPGHFGMYLLYARAAMPAYLARVLPRHRPGISDDEIVPTGSNELVHMIDGLAAAGFSKFVLVPANPPSDWADELAWLSKVLRSVGAT